jgi:hypothetical protein
MLRTAALLSVLVVATWLYGSTELGGSKPSIVPFFSLEPEPIGPAFVIECRNVTDYPLSSASREWVVSRDAVRIDGATLTQIGGVVGSGLSTPIPSGGIWRGILELRPLAGRTSFGVVFDANVRMPLIEPLAAGRHVIAVRCLNEWSDDFPFFWQPQGTR